MLNVLEAEGWISRNEFSEILSGLCRAAPYAERMFAYGHMDLGTYVERAGVRPTDQIFTVLRDLIDLMISQVNYSIRRLRQDPDGSTPTQPGTWRCWAIPSLRVKPTMGRSRI